MLSIFIVFYVNKENLLYIFCYSCCKNSHSKILNKFLDSVFFVSLATVTLSMNFSTIFFRVSILEGN